MTNSILKNGTILAIISLFSISTFANNAIPPKADDNTSVSTSLNTQDTSNSVKVFQQCYNTDEFQNRQSNALNTLKVGYGNNISTHKSGNYTFVDFVSENNQTARLVVNENSKTLMLVTSGK